MSLTLSPATTGGAVKGEVCLHPSRRQLEHFIIVRVPGTSRAKANRAARQALREPDPYSAALGRVIESGMLRGLDPTADTALRRVSA
jgi:hypothetical protein